jgi:2-keto-4-pentenoate hydratase/2-oxohepta-3-ene-1,7-dioic acid hydratase in catechol pathway
VRIVRFKYNDEVKYGVLDMDSISEIKGDVFGKFKTGKNRYNISEVTLLAPAAPSKIVCVGKNYREHALEMGEGIPEEPTLFLKPPTAVINPGDGIIYPDMSQRVDYEGELAVVIKEACKNVPPEDIPRYILGYTCGNDVTARDLQKKDIQWTRGKSFDTFCPLGPWIETELNPDNLKIQTYLNGELKQSSSTAMMITPVYELISFMSRVMTLMPGDVVMTGTPAGIGPMQKGDTVEVVIEGIGKLKNYVL